MDRSHSRDTDGDVVRSQYDWDSTPPSTGVVETVAAALDRDPTALPPLYEYIDPDALDALLESSDPDPRGRDTTLSFVFEGHRVTVSASGEVAVGPDDRY